MAKREAGTAARKAPAIDPDDVLRRMLGTPPGKKGKRVVRAAKRAKRKSKVK